jgi:hypothetical protein
VPVRTWIVPAARPTAVVTTAAALKAGALPAAFSAGVRGLAGQGVAAITTSCGFLVLLQAELQAAVQVPVVTSSLLLLPRILETQPRVGVLTIDADSLGREHLLAAGVEAARLDDVVVQGVDPAGEFATRILGNSPSMDLGRAGADVVAAARRLRERAPDVATVVLECTNMPPYADAIGEATGLRVLSLFDAVATSWTAAMSPSAGRTTAGAPSRTSGRRTAS